MQEGLLVEHAKVDDCSAIRFHSMSWCRTRRDCVSRGSEIGTTRDGADPRLEQHGGDGCNGRDSLMVLKGDVIFDDEHHHNVPRLMGARSISEKSRKSKILHSYQKEG